MLTTEPPTNGASVHVRKIPSMGKLYESELAALPDTYRWAMEAPIDALASAVAGADWTSTHRGRVRRLLHVRCRSQFIASALHGYPFKGRDSS